MSHPSLIEIEPTTSEFTLKYNNGGNVEDIITINPVGKFIDGNDITLKNFTYSNINIEESKVKNLSMENLIVDGKFTFNSYVPGNELVATTDALATNMGNKIQLSTYKKNWRYGDSGFIEIKKSKFIALKNDIISDEKGVINIISSNFKGEISKKTNSELINVFVPTTPNPTSGFLLMFPIDEVIYLNMTFEEASKFIVSAGTSSGKN